MAHAFGSCIRSGNTVEPDWMPVKGRWNSELIQLHFWNCVGSTSQDTYLHPSWRLCQHPTDRGSLRLIS